ncbi:TniQ family protein [Paenibacillus sedimenti]|uniref:TniQ family protein n=1 Tax=Paenibacillus sedimenti TaxID=2770274 RepID=A0A926QM99_9BACL|nr:TniQ family protein [Paenibacillus sedimenti]MBD0384746.1 TniQ family protein [Paenibacillus sedimenti]
MRPVRIRPDIDNQESLSGYLHRVSVINHYPSISIIASDINMTVPYLNNNSFTPNQLTSISNLTGIPKEILQLHSNNYYEQSIGREITNKFVLKNRVKYCPLCIQENIVHKLSWNMLQLNICFEHKIILIENCCGCDSTISLTSFMAGFCDRCGFVYATASPGGIELHELLLDPQLYLFHNLLDQTSSKSFFDITLHDFLILADLSYHLLEGMPSYLGDSQAISCFNKKKNGHRNSKNQSHAYNNAFWMYQDFPHNFYRVLNDFIKQKKPPIMYEQKGQFEQIFEYDSLSEFSEAYNAFWLEKINQGSIRRDFSVFKKNLELLNQREYVRKDEIRTTSGMSYEKMTQLSELNEIDMVISQKGNKTKYLVDKRSYDTALDSTKYLITKKEAALMLGIQKDSVPKLIASGLLKAYHRSSSRYELLSHNDVKQLMDECRGKVVVNGQIAGMKFHDALITYSVNGLTVVNVIKFTREGLLNPVSLNENGTLDQNYYFVNELENCIKLSEMERKNAQGYYLKDVIALLKIGEKKAWKWLESGFLVPDQIITLKDGRKRYLFLRSTIDSLLIKKNITISA